MTTLYQEEPTWVDKLKYSFLSGLIFLIVASPITYRFVRSLFNLISPKLGDFVADARGLATGSGLLLHAFVFSLLVFLTMIVLGNTDEGFEEEYDDELDEIEAGNTR